MACIFLYFMLLLTLSGERRKGKLMKKFFFILSLLVCFILNYQFFCNAEGIAETNVDIKINNQYISFSASPFIYNSIAYVPVRFFADALDAEVLWSDESRIATVSNADTQISFLVNDKTAYVDGVAKKMSSDALIVSGRIFVPVRFIGENLGGSVVWDNYYRNVCIGFENISVDNSIINRSYTDDDVFWLGRIIEAESSGEPLRGKIAVGNVVLNRVKSKEFPNTIYGVIFDRNYGVQFQPILNGAIYNNPSYESMMASKFALKGERPVGDCLYFLNPATASNFWIADNRQYHTTILNHDFYL